MTQPTDADLERRLNWRIAIISASAALAGALVGGLFSHLIALHDSSSQQEEAHLEFVRQQRLTTYSKAISDGTNILYTPENCATNFGQPSIPGQSDAAFTAGVRTLQADAANVEMVGSEKASEDASALQASIGIYLGDCAKQAAGISVPTKKVNVAAQRQSTTWTTWSGTLETTSDPKPSAP